MMLTRVPVVLVCLWIQSVSGNDVRLTREFLASGLTRIFWNSLQPETNSIVSDKCFVSLSHTLRGLHRGFGWAFAFVDASSKTASGTLDGSPSSYGDYDQCLGIQSMGEAPVFHGQHCMARLTIESNNSAEVVAALKKRFPVFDYIHLNQAICLPSACSQEEAERLVVTALSSYPFRLTEEFLCDTAASISWEHKISSLNSSQVVAAGALGTVVFLCILGTLCDLLTAKSTILTDFSLRKTANSLIKMSKLNDSRLRMLDYIKFTVVIVGVGGHCLSCLDTIPSWYSFARLYDIKDKFRSLWIQPMLNEAGMGLVTFVGGFVTFWTTHSLIARGNYRIHIALLEKWVRFVPSIMMMVAIDLLWPLYGSGPMFTGVANHLLNKCTRNSWMNFAFLSNMDTAPENCVPHTFYSSVDMQLFGIGLLVTSLLVRNRRAGVLVSIALIITGNLCLVYFTTKNKASPVMIDAEATREKTVNYLDYVHFGTYSHLSNYFIGVLAALAVTMDGFLDRNAKLITVIFNVAVVMSATVHFAPALHNTFGLLPQHLVPLYIVTIKFFYVFYYSFFLFTNINRYQGHKDQKSDVLAPTKSMNTATRILTQVMARFNKWIFGAADYINSAPVSRLVISLSYAVYVCNYAYIRYDFFTSRIGMPLAVNTLYSMLNRYIYTLWFSIGLAYFFQLFFVAPFDSLRRRLNLRPGITSKSEKSPKS